MSLATTRPYVLSLYKQMMRNARGFKDYNFREYAIRRVRIGFEENKNVEDPMKISELLKSSKKALDSLRRQSLISQMYTEGSYFIEQAATKKV